MASTPDKTAEDFLDLVASEAVDFFDVASAVLKNPELVHARSSMLVTPLMFAAGNNRRDLAALLIEFGADVNAADDEGATPLHWAAPAKSSDCINLLLVHGADPDQPNHKGHTPRTVANGAYMPPDIKKMAPPPVPGTNRLRLSFAAAAAEGDSTLLNKILKEHPDAARWQEPFSGMTALFNAAYYRRLPPRDVALLIEKGADVNVQELVSGWSALMAAVCQSEQNPAVAVLLKAGANPFAKNHEGKTAMDIADLNSSADAPKLKAYAIGCAARVTQKPIAAVKRFSLKVKA